VISPAFAGALAAVRPQLNRRIGEVRRATRGFDDAALTAFLHDAVDPVVLALAAGHEARLPVIVLAAVEAALLLGVHERSLAARTEQVRDTWRALAVPCAALIAAAPAQVLGMLANAVLHLQQQGGRIRQWRDELAALAGRVGSTGELAALGQLLAWRAGMAHFRRGALAAAAGLPPALALAALRLPADAQWQSVATALATDPWWDAREGDTVTGAFTGLGGVFDVPPRVRPADDGFLVASGGRCHLLTDGHGAVLHPASAAEFDAAPARSSHPQVRLQGALLRVGARTIMLDLPVDGLDVTCNAHTVALTSPFTHAIRLLPLP